MSLNFNVSKVKDYQKVTTIVRDGQECWHPHTEALIWLSIPCGYDRITEENLKDVTARVLAWERAFGHSVHNDKEAVPITAAIVKAHVGLTTNASAKSLAWFQRTLGQEMYRDALDRIAAAK